MGYCYITKVVGDLLVTISCLGASTYDTCSKNEFEAGNNVTKAPEECILTEAGEIINQLLHAEIVKIQSNSDIQDPLSFDLEGAIDTVDTLVLYFLNISTCTKREIHSSTLSSRSQTSNHIKKVRQYFLLILFLSCTNLNLSTPLHKLLADVVEVCGKVLNRFGCTCSSDTYDQMVADYAENQRLKSIWSDLQSNALTIATVQTTLICYRTVLQCILVIKIEVIMVQQFNWYNCSKRGSNSV